MAAAKIRAIAGRESFSSLSLQRMDPSMQSRRLPHNTQVRGEQLFMVTSMMSYVRTQVFIEHPITTAVATYCVGMYLLSKQSHLFP